MSRTTDCFEKRKGGTGRESCPSCTEFNSKGTLLFRPDSGDGIENGNLSFVFKAGIVFFSSVHSFCSSRRVNKSLARDEWRKAWARSSKIRFCSLIASSIITFKLSFRFCSCSYSSYRLIQRRMGGVFKDPISYNSGLLRAVHNIKKGDNSATKGTSRHVHFMQT